MNNKTISIVSYITIIGWLVAYLIGKDNLDALSRYHLRQSLGLAIVGFILNIISISILFLGMVVNIIGILLLILMIIGIINAANGEMKPLPVIGKWLEDKFDFIG
ncbi:import component protein [Avrilella dinanensis]|uniref:Import component protein n=1 Tax=Avrilella dinanensis TaxID=2008672 RepID=A0A2M9R396_9FLAO|nr:import component protein [Avrilella dinanensis]PJR03331.1 import component protein [Avrilella dinanensis]